MLCYHEQRKPLSVFWTATDEECCTLTTSVWAACEPTEDVHITIS
uniref:Uncharacterized protein n=1 Tax=Anguilla anguilla TaxID=7936 RepID=A0A0E9XU89_ANGAN